MANTFCEIKLFQVEPKSVNEFESLMSKITKEQRMQKGCIRINCIKRLYVMDAVGSNPRQSAKITKCVKYYSYWEFDSMENYADAAKWFFDNYRSTLDKLLIMPFDINCGYSVNEEVNL